MVARRPRHEPARRAAALARIASVIASVPRGRVITYGQAAAAAGFPGGARLTVWALHRFDGLPWHRVVAAGGRIALSGVDGTEQRLRLRLEGVEFRNGRVRFDRHVGSPRRRLGRGRAGGPPTGRLEARRATSRRWSDPTTRGRSRVRRR
ncbi:MAG TPA: MGMT family protein [Thermoplasmata archaeon]|nr:MGMT family protein [Thermoplasmata archaeon]